MKHATVTPNPFQPQGPLDVWMLFEPETSVSAQAWARSGHPGSQPGSTPCPLPSADLFVALKVVDSEREWLTAAINIRNEALKAGVQFFVRPSGFQLGGPRSMDDETRDYFQQRIARHSGYIGWILKYGVPDPDAKHRDAVAGLLFGQFSPERVFAANEITVVDIDSIAREINPRFVPNEASRIYAQRIADEINAIRVRKQGFSADQARAHVRAMLASFKDTWTESQRSVH